VEVVLDKVKSELNDLAANGALHEILEIKDVHFGDPGNIPVHMYPFIVVEPSTDELDSETTGYEIRNLALTITVFIIAPDHYNPDEPEASGDRVLIQAATEIRKWFMRYSNRRLDWMPDVRHVVVPRIVYDIPPRRGITRVKTATVEMTVQKQYSRQQ